MPMIYKYMHNGIHTCILYAHRHVWLNCDNTSNNIRMKHINIVLLRMFSKIPGLTAWHIQIISSQGTHCPGVLESSAQRQAPSSGQHLQLLSVSLMSEPHGQSGTLSSMYPAKGKKNIGVDTNVEQTSR